MAAMFAVTLLVYSPCVSFEFVEFDDTDYVLRNEHLKGGLTPENVRWAFASRGYADNWHPVAWMSHMLDVDLLCLSHLLPRDVVWGEWDYNRGTGDAWFTKLSQVMHLHNVFLHAANAALLFLLMVVLVRRAARFGILPQQPPNVFVFALLVLFWSLHPLRTEVVCWVSERKELLSVLFMLLSLLAYCGLRRSAANYVLSLAFAALAMLAKPVAVTLPAVLLAWELIFRCRFAVLRVLPFAALALFTCLLTMQSQGAPMDAGAKMPVVLRLVTIFVAPLVYVRQTFWPVGLSMLYEATRHVSLLALAGGGLLVAACAAIPIRWCFLRAVLRRATGFWLDLGVMSVAWIYVGLVPMLGIVKVGGQEHSDRYTYWVGCGACAIAALAWTRLAPGAGVWIERLVRSAGDGDEARTRKECGDVRRLLLGCATAVVVVSAFLTVPQMMTWRNTVSLFRNAVPRSWSTELAKTLAVQLAYRESNGAEEGEKWLRKCATVHRCGLASLNLAEFCLAFRQQDLSVMKVGGTAFSEVEMLVDEARRLGISAEQEKQAAKIMELVEAARKEGR